VEVFEKGNVGKKRENTQVVPEEKGRVIGQKFGAQEPAGEGKRGKGRGSDGRKEGMMGVGHAIKDEKQGSQHNDRSGEKERLRDALACVDADRFKESVPEETHAESQPDRDDKKVLNKIKGISRGGTQPSHIGEALPVKADKALKGTNRNDEEAPKNEEMANPAGLLEDRRLRKQKPQSADDAIKRTVKAEFGFTAPNILNEINDSAREDGRGDNQQNR
jgi:hypothetical protein